MSTPTRARSVRPLWIVLPIVAVVALVAAILVWQRQGEPTPDTPTTPYGDAFYTPPAGVLTEKGHGTVIWSRIADQAPYGGSKTELVLYRSIGANNKPVAVSGTVTIPEGTPPAGGWPVVSWAHGTTGLADRCAPSRGFLTGFTGTYQSASDDFVRKFVKAGYGVVATDYEGLGTPGDHPYLMAQSAGRAMTDLVQAARSLTPDLSTTWYAAGHSQGGQAALFAGAVEQSYQPDLKLAGVIAMAPPSQLADAVNFSAGAPMKVTAFVGPLVVAAARLDGTPLSQVVSHAGQAKLSDIDNKCVGELVGTDSLGGVVSNKFLVKGPGLDKAMQTIRRNDASAVTPRVLTLILQGSKDELVRPDFTDQLDRQLRGRSSKVSYVRKDGVNHVDLLKVAWPDAEKFLRTNR